MLSAHKHTDLNWPLPYIFMPRAFTEPHMCGQRGSAVIEVFRVCNLECISSLINTTGQKCFCAFYNRAWLSLWNKMTRLWNISSDWGTHSSICTHTEKALKPCYLLSKWKVPFLSAILTFIEVINIESMLNSMLLLVN